MDLIVILLVGILGIAAGVAIGIVAGRRKSVEAQTRCKILEARLADKEADFTNRMAEKDESFRRILSEKEEAHRAYDAQIRKNSADALEEMQKRFDETVAKMQEQLKNSTADLLKQRQHEFEESSKADISRIVQPLEQTIDGMKKAVADNTVRHAELGSQLSTNIEHLLKQSEAARLSAERLSNALRSSNNVQGIWGETVLTNLLESQGLQEGVHFDTQGWIIDENGDRVVSDAGHTLKPDVILHLDRHRDVIIDAKVSLSAYLDYVNAKDDEERERALKAHVQSLRQQVEILAKKDYSSYVQPPRTSVGYVIMFVPNTHALYAATLRDPSLWRNAMEKRVYIADEQTLYAALKIIDMTWSQIVQAENHEKVYALANEMLSRVRQFMEKYVAIGSAIENASRQYDAGMKKLSEGGQSIPGTCNKLIKLGARQEKGKKVPNSLLGFADPEEDESAATTTDAEIIPLPEEES